MFKRSTKSSEPLLDRGLEGKGGGGLGGGGGAGGASSCHFRARQSGCPDARDNQKEMLGNQYTEASCPVEDFSHFP